MEKKSGLHYMVAVDGSQASDLAFQVVIKGLLRESDKITVAHVFSKKKDYLPFEMQPNTIKELYTAALISYGSRGNLLWEELDYTRTTKECIQSMAERV